MRLTCPNCGAQYEVPNDVIPAGGRDVQCSNCEQTWFQAKDAEAVFEPPQPAAVEPPPPEPAAETPTPAPADETADKGNVDPAVASILKEEAAREADLRAKEGGSLESQPDLALDPPVEPKVAPKRPKTSETAADTERQEELPDVNAINSGLRSNVVEAEAPVQAPRKSGGFMRGFVLMVIIGAVLFLVYSNATQISEAVPQAEPALQSYISLVDQARVWLEAQTGGTSN